MVTMLVQSGWTRTTRGKICPSYEDLPEETFTSPIYKEHDAVYYKECLDNLREKGINL
ncbi:hypothetical protein MASAN616_04530 [Streptococcus sp. SN-1]|uniref:Uncharacterized protein n=1 Tax=Streptococcus sp. SN-1 TaxID=3074854 RepID=A0AAT9FZF8_9STRE